MRVVHLTYYYGENTSGAPIAATRLHRALLKAGVESHVICRVARDQGVNVHVLPRGRVSKFFSYLLPRSWWVISKLLFGRMVMANVFPLKDFDRTIAEIDPDVVHIHFIYQDFVSFAQLKRINRPLVYSLHDALCFNALDPNPVNDNRFAKGYTRKNSTWIERRMFERKRKFVETTDPKFCGPSKWICELFGDSIIGKGRSVTEIGNLIDPVFAYDSENRVKCDRFTMLFGAFGGRRTKNKGWDDFVQALALLPTSIKNRSRVIVFGESAERCSVNGVEVEFAGLIESPRELCLLHHKADVFVFPSVRETQGMVKLEALASGLPVLAFARSACAEAIRTKENGWVSPDGDTADYARGLEFFFRRWSEGTLEEARARISAEARALTDDKLVVEKMISLYLKVAGRDDIMVAD